MGSTLIWAVEFQIRKPNPAGSAVVNLYVKPARKALVSASTQQGIAAVLNSNVTLAAGEVLEIIGASQYSEGAESGSVWT
jgi:hypothetical protein